MSIEAETQPIRAVDLEAEAVPSDAESHLESVRRRCHEIYNSEERRVRLLRGLCSQVGAASAETADYALVFGTSLEIYPDKFRERVYWASMLWHKNRVNHIIFTGKNDNDTNDVDQAEDARQMAMSEFGVSEVAILKAGGSNSQQNVVEASELISEGSSVFAVSDLWHEMRAITVARAELAHKHVSVYASPAGGQTPLDPNSPRVIMELIKAEGYNHSSYRRNQSLTDAEVQYLQKETQKMINGYNKEMKPRLLSEAEQPFSEWREQLPSEFQIPTVAVSG